VKIGIISDTHGLLRPEIFDRFAGVDHILHAGDIGPADLLVELQSIAPVTAVWGNTDGMEIRARVPEVARVELAGRRVVVAHGHRFGAPTPAKLADAYGGADLVVFGHSHVAVVERVGATLAVNPGSAGPPRFRTTPSLAIGEITAADIRVEVLQLGAPRGGE
jgi:uncharacterized protein